MFTEEMTAVLEPRDSVSSRAELELQVMDVTWVPITGHQFLGLLTFKGVGRGGSEVILKVGLGTARRLLERLLTALGKQVTDCAALVEEEDCVERGVEKARWCDSCRAWATTPRAARYLEGV